MQHYPLVTYKRPCCFWGEDLQGENAWFLDTLAPEYYGFVAMSNEERLAGDDRLKAAVAIRTAYGQAVETLFALLAATVQAPHFPLGWLIRYRVAELRQVVDAIERGGPLLTRLTLRPLTWDRLSAMIHEYVPEPARSQIVSQFAGFWKRLAGQFLREDFAAEYNSIKHSLRIMPGGFSVRFGVQKSPGEPAAAGDMHSLGGSEFGSSFYVAKVIGPHEHELTLNHQSRNWSVEALVVDLQLVAQSLQNVISFLRTVAGRQPTTVRFSWPSDGTAFDADRRTLLPVETMTFTSRVEAADITPMTADEIRAVYEEATNDGGKRNT